MIVRFQRRQHRVPKTELIVLPHDLDRQVGEHLVYVGFDRIPPIPNHQPDLGRFKRRDIGQDMADNRAPRDRQHDFWDRLCVGAQPGALSGCRNDDLHRLFSL